MSFRLNMALLLVRVAGALAFLYHGSSILFGAFDGPGPERFAASQHMEPIFGYLVGVAQLCGGAALLLGVLTRVGAVCIIIVMSGAIQLVHWKRGFDIGHGGMEYAVTQLLLACALLIAGPGEFGFSRFLPRALRKL